MTEYQYKYEIELRLAFPNYEAPLNFEQGDTESKLYRAESVFNARFEGRKEINIIHVEGQSLTLLLSISFIPNNATKEISAFSQILVKDFKFDHYSAKPGRLFKYDIIEVPRFVEEMRVADKASKDYLQEKVYASSIKEEFIDYEQIQNSKMTSIEESRSRVNTFIKMSNEILVTDDIDLLDNYIKQLENLTALAKSKKDIMLRSNI